MLLGFSLKNVLSYKNEQFFSLYAQNNLVDLKEENTFSVRDGKESILKSLVFYGKNAGGKSNLFKALEYLKREVLSIEKPSNKKIKTFIFDVNSKNQPLEFSIEILIEDIIYTYDLHIHDGKIVYEALGKNVKRSTLLFVRNSMEVDVKVGFKKANKIKAFTDEKTCFLSTTGKFNIEESKKVIKWFKNLKIISGESFPEIITLVLSKNNEIKSEMLKHLKISDTDIKDFFHEESETVANLDELPFAEAVKLMIENRDRVYTQHFLYDKEEVVGSESLELSEESSGTQKYFSLLGPLVDTLKKGGVLFIDELDSKLHLLLTEYIVKLFNSTLYNPENAQLIFNTHNSFLMRNDLFRKDQIWFVEKDSSGSTELYSLSDFKKNGKPIKNSDNYQKQYLRGEYGAVPKIDFYHNVIEE